MNIKYNNNYSAIEKDFFKKTGLNLTSGRNGGVNSKQRIGIIIPTHNSAAKIKKILIGLNNQGIDDSVRKRTEIIIVDDGSSDFNVLRKAIQKSKSPFKTKLAHFKNNQGRSSARNLGVALSSGEILIFLDGDIIPNRFWLAGHILRQELYKNIAIVGFNESIGINDRRISDKNILMNFSSVTPNYKKDFRYQKFVPLEWRLTRPEIDKKTFGKSYKVLNQSNKFKNFNQNTVIGVWDLPYMLLSGNFSIRKEQFVKADGFSLDFKGWGMEDTHLGFRLIANKVFIIPLLSATGFHIVSGKKESDKKMREFRRNLEIYKEKIKSIPKLTTKKSWLEKIFKRFKGKYIVVEDINS